MIPNDYSRCSGEDCPFRDSCARFMEVKPDVVYSFMAPAEKVKEGKECKYFIPHIKYVCNPPRKRK